MRLLFPAPIGDRLHEADTVEVPGLVLRVVAVEPLPDDRGAWRLRIVGAEVAHERLMTPTGWPLVIVQRERAMWGFYELLDRGVVVAVTATGEVFDAVAARALLAAADLDRTTREVVALAQLWDEPHS